MNTLASDRPVRLHAAIIVDNNRIARWQAEALAACAEHLHISVILNCRNTQTPRAYGRHFLYYLLNLACLRNRMAQPSAINADKALETIDFDSRYAGAWQSIPAEVIAAINEKPLDLIIKFGMNLLTVPETLKARFGILSFHHGDPVKYRGRPAGFYEVLNNEDKVGVIVQRLSNKMDAGEICASANSKLWHISYRRTAETFYRNSIPLLRRALINLENGETLANPATGRNYSLPGNLQVLWFLCVLAKRKLSWYLYGAMIEKKWNIMVCKDPALSPLQPQVTSLKMAGSLVPKIDADYVFYADPFFSSDGSRLYVETMNKSTGLGEIVVMNKDTCAIEKTLLKGGHHSFPQALRIDGSEYLLPEISNISSPCLVRINAGEEPEYLPIAGLEDYRIVDATYFQNADRHYIFASISATSKDNLQLFVASSAFGPYTPHPMNPIVIDPACARMAGEIVRHEGKLLRLGQDSSYGYGDNIWFCEIEELSPTRYREKKVKLLSFEGKAAGPHTLNFHGDMFVTDFFVVEFTPLAGYRRFLRLLVKLKGKYLNKGR